MASTSPAPFWLDVDTGLDDALAILLAASARNARIAGISCVAGNTDLASVVANTLKVLDVAGAPEITVAAGCARPLFESLREPSLLHGRDGMGDLGLPASRRAVSPLHAVEALRRAVLAEVTPLTLVQLAPLTNLALFARMYPELLGRIGRVFVMGGAYLAHGNTSPVAEFNFRQDPEALSIVVDSGLPLTLYPLDSFRAVVAPRAVFEALAASANPGARVAGQLLRYEANYFGREDPHIGDAGTMAVALDPSHAVFERFPVSASVSGESRGSLIVDRRSPKQRDALNDWWATSPRVAEIVTGLDAGYYQALFADGLL